MNDPLSSPHVPASSAPQQTRKRLSTQPGPMWVIVSVAILFLSPEYLTPPYDIMALGLGSAALFTIFLSLYPESFRNRAGSLAYAYFLTAVLWLLAVVGLVLSFVS